MASLRLVVLHGEIRYVLHVGGQPFLDWPVSERAKAFCAYLEAQACG